MKKDSFARFWEKTLSPGTPNNLAAQWREHELSAVQRGEVVVERLTRFTSLEGRRILDVGCGYGGIAVALAQAGGTVVGFDSASQRILGASVRVRSDHPGCAVRLIQAVGEQVPLRGSSFDIVVCNDVLEHVGCRKRTLQEVGRVLKPDGWLYLTFPNRLSLANFLRDPHYHLLGVSLLPPWLAKWYVVSVRKRAANYQVRTFPIASRIRRLLGQLNLRVAAWWPAPKRQMSLLTPLWRLFRLNTQPLITMICHKPGRERSW